MLKRWRWWTKWVGGNAWPSVLFFNILDSLLLPDDDTDKPAILPKENEKARKSLNFESLEDRSGGSTPVLYEFNTTRKRQQDEIFGSLSDDDDLNKSG